MIAFAVAVLALAAPPPEAPPPKLIEIYRSPFDPELSPVPSGFRRTISLAFSPDERWIALVMGALTTDLRRAPALHLASTLLLLPLYPSQSPRVQISPGMPAGEPKWSPDSGSLAVWAIPATQRDRYAGGIAKLFDLSGKLLWTGPPTGPIVGFIAPGRLLAQHAKRKGRFSGFDTVDVRTSAVTAWPASGAASRHWYLVAMNPDRHLLAVFPDTEGSKTLIVDYATGKVLQSMNNQVDSSAAPWVFFAEHGKTLCSAASPSAFSNHAICRDVDTGKTIAELKAIDGGEPADTSAGGSRMVVTKVNDFSGGDRTYSGNVVWDFRSGAEIAAWAASGLQVRPIFLSVVPPAVTISSSGRYVALQLGEEVHIYELP